MLQSPLRRWDVLANYAKSLDAKKIVEVGCKEGRTTAHLLKSTEAEVIAIDPWAPVPNDAETYEDWDFKAIEAEFWRLVEPYRDRLTMLRTTSVDAATQVEDADLIFIDAGHDEPSVDEDIKAWWPKVRPGGMLAGHDYQHKFPGVMRSVAKFFPLMQVGLAPDSVWFVVKGAA